MNTTRTQLRLALGVLAAGCLVGCDEGPSTPSSTTNPPPAPRATTPSTPPPGTPADNTATNKRDRDGNTVTPLDQGETEQDRRVASEIRSAVLARSGMSMNAQNCKIVSRGGVVTLRGPVASQAEKDAIGAIAKSIAGVASVTNDLEVTP